MLELKAAIAGIAREFERGHAARADSGAGRRSITEGRMLLGTDIARGLRDARRAAVDVIGLNCSTGPAHMRDSIRYLVRELALLRQRHPQRRACR